MKKKKLSFGQRAADAVSTFGGSWRFVIYSATLLTVWIVTNVVLAHFVKASDPYPFILLNLFLSFIASFIASFQVPFIMMSQNRQSEIDRNHAIEDLEIDKQSELEIEDVRMHLHRIQDTMELMLQRNFQAHAATSIFQMQVDAHEQDRTLEEHIWYPEHEPRKESAEFRRNKKHLHDIDAPCYICGAKRSEGAKIEIHHKLEWAFWNGFDHERIKKELGIDNPDALENLIPLCEPHHRGRFTGVHSITGPVWEAQKWAAQGMSFTEHDTFQQLNAISTTPIEE